MNKKLINKTALALVLIGAINWGLAVFDVNLVSAIFRFGWLINTVYILVAISGLYLIKDLFKSK